ncbi:MAG: hypothetical protein PHY62_04970 [Gallionella sp.]|nr:hypothetical protein [Gallionella sp.]
MATFTDAATQNRISQLLFTAADQNYGPIQKGDALAPINNIGGYLYSRIRPLASHLICE